MDKEDKVTSYKYETLHSLVQTMEWDMLYLKVKIAAARLIPPRPPLERKLGRWPGSFYGIHAVSCWTNVRGTENEVREHVTRIKAAIPADVQDKFGWDVFATGLGNDELKMKAFLWCKSGVGFWDRRRALSFIFKELEARPIFDRGFPAREVLEIPPVKRPWKKHSPSFSEPCSLLDWAGARSKSNGCPMVFGYLWVITSRCINCRRSPLGQKWEVDEARLLAFKPDIDMELVRTCLEEVCLKKQTHHNPRSILDRGSFERSNVTRDKGAQCCDLVDDLQHKLTSGT